MLAVELISEVLSYLTIPLELSFSPSIQKHKPVHAVLSACSLVCKEWSYLAQRLLFQRVTIRSDREKPLTISGNDVFLSAIDPRTEKGAWLASCIRMFIFIPRGASRGVEPGVVSSQLFSSLLCMRNLRHLDLYGVMCTFSNAQFAQLRAEGPELKSLHAHLGEPASTPRTVDSQENAYRLAACFPSIQVLQITSSYGVELRPSSPFLNLSLTAFIVSIDEIQDPVQCFIASLVREPHAGDDGLQCLSVHSIEDRGYRHSWTGELTEEKCLVETFGPTLLSLSVDDLATSTTAAALRRCTQLKRLELSNLPHPALLPSLPRTLEDLSLPSSWRGSDGTIVKSRCPDLVPLMAELEDLPHLRKLTISNCENEPHFNPLGVLCDQRGIELQISSGEYVNSDDFLIAIYKDLLELNLN